VTVYFAATSDRVKIGFTRDDVSGRLMALRTATADHVRLLHTVVGATRSAERALHYAFAFARVRNGSGGREWFRRGAVEPHVRRGRDVRQILESLLAAQHPAPEHARITRLALLDLDATLMPPRRKRTRVAVQLDNDVIGEIDRRLERAFPGRLSPGERATQRAYWVRVLIRAGIEASEHAIGSAIETELARERERRGR